MISARRKMISMKLHFVQISTEYLCRNIFCTIVITLWRKEISRSTLKRTIILLIIMETKRSKKRTFFFNKYLTFCTTLRKAKKKFHSTKSHKNEQGAFLNFPLAFVHIYFKPYWPFLKLSHLYSYSLSEGYCSNANLLIIQVDNPLSRHLLWYSDRIEKYFICFVTFYTSKTLKTTEYKAWKHSTLF